MAVPSHPVRQSARTLTLRVFIALGVVALLVEVLARSTVPTQRRLGLDTRSRGEVLAEQSQLISARLASPGGVIVTDSVLGWRNNPGYADAAHAINRMGARSTREYTDHPATGKRRVLAYGDAYVYGAEVSTMEAWSTLIEEADPSVEVINFGVGGYGSDQALLLYLRTGASLAPEIVLMGFAPVDLRRAVTRYTRFFSTDEPPMTKPRFVVDATGALVLLPNPMQSREEWERLAADPLAVLALGPDDAWYDRIRYEHPLLDRSAAARLVIAGGLRVWRKYLWSGRLVEDGQFRPGSAAFAVQRAILKAFADSVRARGATAVIMMLPDAHSVAGAQVGQPTVFSPLVDSLRTGDHLEVLDLTPAFVEHAALSGGDGLFAPGGHFGPVGSSVIAKRLLSRIREPAAVSRRSAGASPLRED